jgi:hypothetical protein
MVTLKYDSLRALDVLIWKEPCTPFEQAIRLLLKRPFPYTHGVMYLGAVVQGVHVWFNPNIQVTISSLPTVVEKVSDMIVLRPRGTIMTGVNQAGFLKTALDMATDGLPVCPTGINGARAVSIQHLWGSVYSEIAQAPDPESFEQLLEANFSEVISQS